MEIPPRSSMLLTLEQKKERQRQHVKRSYYRKLDRINKMREEVNELEKRYTQALNLHAQIVDKTAGSDEGVLLAIGDSVTQQQSASVEAYTKMSQLKEELRQENAELQHQVTKWESLAIKMKRFTAELDEEKSEAEEIGFSKLRAVPTLINPMMVGECQEIACREYKEICQFLLSSTYVTTGARVFGWRDRRKVEHGLLKFTLTKLFYGFTPAQLSLRGWPVFTSMKSFSQLYSQSMNAQLHKIQEVDDDNFIVFRVFQSSQGKAIARSLFLVTRMQIDNGYMILFRSIDRERLMTLPTSTNESENPSERVVQTEQWLDMYTWILFKEAGDNKEHCELDFGGIVPSTSVVSTEIWLMEVLFIALRWQAQVQGPIFSLC